MSRADFCALVNSPLLQPPGKFSAFFPGSSARGKRCTEVLPGGTLQNNAAERFHAIKTLKNAFGLYSEQMWFVSIFRPYLTDNDFFVCFVLYLASAKDCAQDIDTPPPTLHFSPFSSSTELPT